MTLRPALVLLLLGKANAGCNAALAKASFGESGLGCSLDDIASAAPPNSAALHAYLQRTYGEESEELSRLASTWNWSAVGIVWRDALPPLLRARCVPMPNATANATLWAAAGAAPPWLAAATPNGAIWANEKEPGVGTTLRGLWANDELAPDSPPAEVKPGHWVEVTHKYFPGRVGEEQALWMYQAKGSGLFKYTGTRLVTRNHVSLLEALRRFGYQNVSLLGPGHGQLDWLRHVQTYGYGGEVIDTVEFMDHADPCWPTTRHELVGLRFEGGTDGRCPPSEDMRTGPRGERVCACENPTLRAGESVRCVPAP